MGTGEINPAAAIVEPLTPREQEIIGLLAQGFSPVEIAEKLVLAVSSVRWHLQHAYHKLGVHTKRQAINRARELAAARQAAPASNGPKHNLTRELTQFFGRETEIAHVSQMLAKAPLVTLTGPGGVGKTRLSKRVAEAVLDRFPDGVSFVELAPLSEPTLVAQQVASCLELRDEPGQPILETLAAALHGQETLLILDNCEHLLEACARLADSLLRACPRLRILASSREPLGVGGEAIFQVPSLDFPDPDHLPALAVLKEYLAVRLFVDRASLVLPEYQVTERNAPALARICQRLDGIPLAIELAAARMPLLTAEQMANRLDDAFGVLTGGPRTALPKHQTLRATLDWGYTLLSERERLLLQRLSVFAGGCTLEAAESVCAGEGLAAGEVLGCLGSLVAKSMVTADQRQASEARYRLLEMVRQYGREKLASAGETQRMFTRHRDWVLALAEMKFGRPSSEMPYWSRKLMAEQENLRAALEWSFRDSPAASAAGAADEGGQLDAGPRLVFASASFANLASHEIRYWCDRALAWCRRKPGVSPRVYAKLLGIAGKVTGDNDLPTGVAMGKQAVELARRLGPAGRDTLVWNLVHVGSSLTGMDALEDAQAHFDQAEMVFQELGQANFPPSEYLATSATLAHVRAHLANKQGRHTDAKGLASEGLRLMEASGDPWGSWDSRLEMGFACFGLGEYEAARGHFLKALGLVEDIALYLSGDRLPDPSQSFQGHTGLAYVKRWLALVDLRQENLERALNYCRASLRQAEQIPERTIIASDLGISAAIWARRGQPLRAARLAGAAQSLYAKQTRNPWEDLSLDTLLPGWRDGPDQAEIERAFEAGKSMTVAAAVADVLSDVNSW